MNYLFCDITERLLGLLYECAQRALLDSILRVMALFFISRHEDNVW
jgi:hypothetical protein